MPSHAGQVAFPGGGRQDGDADAADTALREAHEEVGLERHFVDVVGAVDLYRTGTGFEITPVVGSVTPGFTTLADPREVADVFEVHCPGATTQTRLERRPGSGTSVNGPCSVWNSVDVSSCARAWLRLSVSAVCG